MKYKQDKLDFIKKLQDLNEWFHFIIYDIQDQLKLEHLIQNKTFLFLYFTQYCNKYKRELSGIYNEKDNLYIFYYLKNIEKIDTTKLTLSELVEGYRLALSQEEPTKKKELSEYITSCKLIFF